MNRNTEHQVNISRGFRFLLVRPDDLLRLPNCSTQHHVPTYQTVSLCDNESIQIPPMKKRQLVYEKM